MENLSTLTESEYISINKMKKIYKKIISIILIVTLVISVNMSAVWAVETPQTTETPTTTETTQTETTTTDENTQVETETPTRAEQPQAPENASPTPTLEPTPATEEETTSINPESTDTQSTQDDTQNDPVETTPSSTGSQTENGNLEDTTIQTDTANTSGTITTLGNLNAVTGAATEGTGDSNATIVNTGNGSNSDNSGTVDTTDTSATIQDNNANINNNLNLDSDSGNNSAGQNLGDSTIETGDANTTGTILNSVNTNIEGVLVSETNIVEDTVGDVVLDFAATCVAGCESGSETIITNLGNGSESENTGLINETADSLTSQNNDAVVGNEMVLTANSGNNLTNDNTNGDSNISTGDANVVGNVLNFLNNNLAGNVIFSVVNIFGDLVGDIIIPSDYAKYFASAEQQQSSVANESNGSNSENTGIINNTNSQETAQFNNAEIVNNVELVATTGTNQTSNNTAGDNKIETGNAYADSQIVNIANNNFDGGTWWIVIVNEAGKWVGRIFGPSNATVTDNIALAPGAEFTVAGDGAINITNAGNGAGSTNTGTANSETNQTTIQNSNANLTNNVKLIANTGGNSASRNTGGDNQIVTGDASVLLNIVNFVNNNFAGGQVLLTFVNVFGSWTGDLLAPGASKDADELALGGTESNPTQASNQSSSTGTNNQSGRQNSGNAEQETEPVTPVGTVLVAGYKSFRVPEILANSETQIDNPLGLFSTEDTDKAKITINLAWLLVFLPLVLALIVISRIRHLLNLSLFKFRRT